MEDEKSSHWPRIIMFPIIGGIFIWLMGYMLINTPAAADTRSHETSMHGTNIENYSAMPEELYFNVNQEIRIAKKLFIYRGVENKKIKMEVVIPALDPGTGYIYRTGVKEAKKGFRMSGNSFKLITLKKNWIRLKRS